MDFDKTDLLHKYLDGDANADETIRIHSLLSTDAEFKRRAEELMALRGRLAQCRDADFADDFSGKVMNRVQQINLSGMTVPWLNDLVASFKPVAWAAIFLIVIFTAMNFLRAGKITPGGIFSTPEVSIEEVYITSTNMLTEP